MKPIAVVVTDVHLNGGDDTPIACFNQVVDLCVSLGVGTIINLGDTFTYKRSQPLRPLKNFGDILDLLLKNNIKMISLVGNHDKPDTNSVESFMDLFDGHSALELIQESAQILSDGIYALSYFPNDSGQYASKLDAIPDGAILLTHVGIDGGKPGVPGMAVSEFSRFKKVLSGHYHDANEYGNITYVGSMYQANYGESDDKGCSLLYPDGKLEHVKLVYPTYGTLVVRPEQGAIDAIYRLVAKEVSGYGKLRVTIVGSEADCNLLSKDRLYDLGVDKVEKNVSSSDSDQNTGAAVMVIHNADSILKEFEDFCKQEGYDGMDIGNKIINEIRHGKASGK